LYGAQRVLSGEVSLRDFMSYDPGRYYWSAALMSAWHDEGILSLRVAVFQFVGLFVGLLLLLRGRSRSDVALFVLAAITMLTWMHLRHKLFDISLSILLIGILAFLVQQQPSRWRFFLAGAGVGLVAVLDEPWTLWLRRYSRCRRLSRLPGVRYPPFYVGARLLRMRNCRRLSSDADHGCRHSRVRERSLGQHSRRAGHHKSPIAGTVAVAGAR
jgi:hypothetical protein